MIPIHRDTLKRILAALTTREAPDRVAQVVAWLERQRMKYPRSDYANWCRYFQERIEAGEPFKETPDE